jgi:hypothetical protein
MMFDVRHPMMGSSCQAPMMMMTSDGEATGCNQYGMRALQVADGGVQCDD